MEQDAKRVDLTCGNCKFYEKDMYNVADIPFKATYGRCRRFPPKPISLTSAEFPPVDEDSWCGEHQKKFAQSDK